MNQSCPIWGTLSAISVVPGSLLDSAVDSPRAGGKYIVNDNDKYELSTLNDREKVKLTSWLVEQRNFGYFFPKITSGSILEAQQRKELRIAERVDRILRYLESKTSSLGTEVHLRLLPPDIGQKLDDDHLIFFELLRYSESVNSDELISLLNHLEERGYIKLIGFKNNIFGTYFLTVNGYERLEETNKPSQNSTKVFVAMWFNPSMDEVWAKGIKPAITEAGYEPVRIDKKEDLNKIDDEIIAEIRRSRFVVADFTHGKIDDNDLPIEKRGARGGVYYEAGFAHGLGIDVVFTCREDMIETVQFDTRQYPHIMWDNPQDLKFKLANRIAANFGDSPLKSKQILPVRNPSIATT